MAYYSAKWDFKPMKQIGSPAISGCSEVTPSSGNPITCGVRPVLILKSCHVWPAWLP